MKRIITILHVLICTLGLAVLSAQSLSPESIALSNLKSEYADLGLTETDVAELRIRDNYISNGVQHIFVQQFYQGVPIANGIASMHFKDGKLAFRTSNLSTGFEEQLPATVPTITAIDAVKIGANPLDVTTTNAPELIRQDGDKLTYSWSEISNEPVTAQLVFADIDGKLSLAWQIYIEQINTPDMWVFQIDALSGLPIGRDNHTKYSSLNGADNFKYKNSHMGQSHAGYNAEGNRGLNPNLPVHEALIEASLIDGSAYNVFPFGIEAPIFGERELVQEPADVDASPFGWHDTNGSPGAEFTTTRGNNVWAYPDRTNSGSPDPDITIDGGSDLQFDFFYEDFGDLDSILPAATTQLFFTINKLHDWAWHHGFDAPSGNYQQNNYGEGGLGNDPIRAEAQDGSGTNNANFGTGPDGGSGRMQMYVWENGANTAISVDEPANLSATLQVGSAQYGPQSIDQDITASIAIALDGSASPELVCEDVVNVGDVNGKIALIRRGDCFFEQKTLNAEAAGAVAVIICNPENTLLNMAGGVDDDEPTIPSVLIEEFRCAEIRAAIQGGTDVVVTFPESVIPPPIDGDFDNGIVAHEFGHGISLRLVGGPSTVGCLGNDEQMGEGWSDFCILAASPLNGSATFPTGAEPRGVGNFAINAGTNGGGIRRQPYSTDMAVNDFTYDDIITSGVPHPLGEIWGTTLWDLYWALTDEYGFDSNLVSGTGGNNIAVELVIEGMKFTTCSPGMVDGRNGILAADQVLNDGANQCIIWEVFARRGLGWSADQGSPGTRFDGVEAFDVNPACIPTVKLSKETNEVLVDAGQGYEVELSVRNDKAEAVTNVVITDELPDGLTVVEGSVSGTSDFTINAGSITFTISGIDPEGDATVNYEVTTAEDQHSIPFFFDGAEFGDEEWSFFPLNGEGLNLWGLSNDDPFEGDAVWFVENTIEANDQIITPLEPFFMEGENPGLRFYTQYNTEAKWDAGIIEFSTDGTNWDNVGNDRLIRGQYRGEVEQSAFDGSVSDFNSYWGVSGGYREVIVDFTDLAGQQVFVRWRFGSDAADTAPNGTPGWWIDNIEVMDVFRYNGLASLTTDQGDQAEAFGQDGGVVIQSMEPDPNSTVDPTLGTTNVNVFPNPANDFLNVRITSERAGDARIQLLSVDGRILSQQVANLVPGTSSTAQFNTANLAAGVYLVQVLGADRVHTQKVSIQ